MKPVANLFLLVASSAQEWISPWAGRHRASGSLLVAMFLLVPAGRAGEQAEKPRAPIAIAEIKRTTTVDFEKEILPLLKNNCLACHNQTTTKAELVLENPKTILKGGETGPAVVPGKSSESLLLQVASHQTKPNMPPRENKVAAVNFTPDELGLIKLWIDQGATGEVHGAGPIVWQPLPEGLNPIYAVALTPDGQFAACGRANQIFVYHLPSGQLVTRLTDPSLAKAVGSQKLGAAHRDLVQSLAFNPEGTILASGGYREVKLWRRPRNVQTLRLASGGTNAMDVLTVSADRKWLASAGADRSVRLWNVASGALVKTLTGHEKPITALRFSADGSRLYSGSLDRSIRIWSLAEGVLFAQTNLAAEVHALTLVAGGRQLATGGSDQLIQIWDVPTETNAPFRLIKTLKGHTGSVTALDALGADGRQLISGGADGSVRQWDVAKGELIRELKHGGPVAALAARADGKRFASASLNSVARLWDSEKGSQIEELKGDRYAREKVSETDRALAVAQAEVAYRKTALTNAGTLHRTQVDRVTKATGAYTNAEKVYVEKQTVRTNALAGKAAAEKAVLDLNAEIKKITESFESADKTAKQAADKAKASVAKAAQSKAAADQALQAGAETERLAAEVARLAASTKAVDEKLAGEAQKAALSVKGLAENAASDAAGKGKAATEARAQADQAIDELGAKAFAAGQIKVAYDKIKAEAPERQKQSTNQLNTATKTLADAEQEFKKVEQTKSIAENEMQLGRNAAKQAGEALAEAKAGLERSEGERKNGEVAWELAKKKAVDSEQPIRAMAFSPDNRTLATAGDDGLVHTWSAETGRPFEVFRGQARAVASLAFAGPNSLFSGADDANAVLWDLNPAWTLERTLGTGESDSTLIDRVSVLRFRRDGKYLASGGGEPSRGSEIKVWQPGDGRLWQEFKNVHSDTVLAFDFSPDGKYLASGAADKFVKVLDLATGKVVKSLEGHTHHVLGVSWKSDGRTLVSSGADNVIKVWDFITGERKKTIEGFGKEVTSISFLGNTDQALASAGDNQVRIVRENGETVRALAGATDYMYSSAATADGRIIVAGGADSLLRVWDGADGKEINAFAPPARE